MSAALDIEFNQDQEGRLRRAIEEREQHGDVTPGRLLEHARPETSDIHDCFEWVDATAAERFRLHQARTYIRTVRVTVQKVEQGARTLRIVQSPALPTIPAPEPTKPVSELMIESAKADLAAFHRKYKCLRSVGGLDSVFHEIELLIWSPSNPSHAPRKAKAVRKPEVVSLDPGCENLVSRGLIKRGKSVCLPEVLRPENLPSKPPGR